MERPNIIKIIGTLIVLFVVALGVSYYFNWYRGARYLQSQSQPRHVFTTPVGVRPVLSTSVKIVNCQPEPDSAVVSTSTVVTFMNMDSVPHTLFFQKSKLAIAANASAMITFDFFELPGSYYYDCDSHKNTAIVTVPFKVTTKPAVQASSTKAK